MTKLLKLAMLAGVFAFFAQNSEAGQRYATPPPVTLSPDLSSTWTLQLRAAPRIARRHSTARRQRPAQPKRLFRSPDRQKRVARLAAPRQTVKSRAAAQFDPSLLPAVVSFHGAERPGTIVVDTIQRRLFLVMEGGKARRYAVGVGKPGFEWAGTHKVTRKAEWPSWRPPAEMIARERRKGRELPAFMPGGVKNPLGARALYLGSTIYRIHGTNQDWSIGKAVSSGCIRMRNEDVMDLYERVGVGTKVRVI